MNKIELLSHGEGFTQLSAEGQNLKLYQVIFMGLDNRLIGSGLRFYDENEAERYLQWLKNNYRDIALLNCAD